MTTFRVVRLIAYPGAQQLDREAYPAYRTWEKAGKGESAYTMLRGACHYLFPEYLATPREPIGVAGDAKPTLRLPKGGGRLRFTAGSLFCRPLLVVDLASTTGIHEQFYFDPPRLHRLEDLLSAYDIVPEVVPL